MRNAECGMKKKFLIIPHSAFRIPHSVYGSFIEIIVSVIRSTAITSASAASL
jgi:hypothetical protein